MKFGILVFVALSLSTVSRAAFVEGNNGWTQGGALFACAEAEIKSVLKDTAYRNIELTSMTQSGSSFEFQATLDNQQYVGEAKISYTRPWRFDQTKKKTHWDDNSYYCYLDTTTRYENQTALYLYRSNSGTVVSVNGTKELRTHGSLPGRF